MDLIDSGGPNRFERHPRTTLAILYLLVLGRTVF